MSQFKILKESLKLLAMPYEDQRKLLPDFVEDVQDDITTDFGNAFLLIPQLMDEEKLSYQAVKKILQCYIEIDINLSNKDLNYNAFESHESWQKVRKLAKEALLEMGES